MRTSKVFHALNNDGLAPITNMISFPYNGDYNIKEDKIKNTANYNIHA